jgi:NAD(P)H-hydrate epimerase
MLNRMPAIRPLERDEVREVDRRAIADFGMSGLVLMENAGRGCVDVLLELGCRGPVTIVCGRGNNAGDGFVIARHLDFRGVAVKVVLLAAAGDLRGDAASNYAIIERAGLTIVDCSRGADEAAIQRELKASQWVVDAILGTRASGPPREPFAAAIRAINAAAAKRLAVDLPSGLDCNTGQPADPTVRADDTCTFVAQKIGFSAAGAAPYIGQVHVVDIGVPRRLVEEFFMGAR